MKEYFDANVTWVKENTEVAVNAINGAFKFFINLCLLLFYTIFSP